MEHKQPNREWRSAFARFRRDRSGAIAPLAAVVITAALIGVGASIDISRLVTARTQLQDAVDSADLALARMPASTTDADMQAKAKAWITANVTDPNIKSLVVATPVRTLGQVQLNVTGSINTTLASLMGVNTLPIEGHSTVKYGTTHVELALVLDNTGSMNQDNKLSSLKSAATTLVNTLNDSAKASNDPNALKVSVVPFSMAVNIGSQYRGKSWLVGKMPAEYGSQADAVDPGHHDRFALLDAMTDPATGKTMAWGGCVENRPMPYDVSDAAPDSSTPATLFVPFFSPDTADDGYYAYYGSAYRVLGQYPGNDNNYWSANNYLADGIKDGYTNSQTGGDWFTHQNNVSKYKGTITSYTSNEWQDKIGPNSGCTVKPIQRLTADTSTVLNQIQAMTASGDTEIPIGLVWGWHVLSPNLPFADGVAYGSTNTIKVIVLVTDGANTYSSSADGNFSYYTAQAFAQNLRITSTNSAGAVQSALNSRLQTLCSNMKTKNADGTWKINIYTVPLEVTDTNIKSLLQGCVTDPSNYLDVASSSQLADAFANIAGSISALRVAH